MIRGEKMDKKHSFEIKIENLEKSFGELQVLKRINLSIAAGEFVAIVGHSGCGKSTLLRLIAGLDKTTAGTVSINGEVTSSINDSVRYLFQEPRLLPWETIEKNISIGMKKSDDSRVQEALNSVGLSSKQKEWPKNLSGGQKQRVALARALVSDPGVLLLDEPLGALDALTKLEMQRLIESLWYKQGFTAILVTHDVDEAVYLADRVFVMEDGKIKDEIEIALARPRVKGSDKVYYSNLILDQILEKELKQPLEEESFIIGSVK